MEGRPEGFALESAVWGQLGGLLQMPVQRGMPGVPSGWGSLCPKGIDSWILYCVVKQMIIQNLWQCEDFEEQNSFLPCVTVIQVSYTHTTILQT